MIKAITQHGTYYLIDFEKNRALRVKGPYSHEIIPNNVWFAFLCVSPFDRDSGQLEESLSGSIEIGKSMYFQLRSFERTPWILTSNVVSIEEVEDVYSRI
jgi:hypothetical protein